MSCTPSWSSAGESCPYGRKLPLEVTLPNDPDFWQVVSVALGYTPWIISLGILILFLIYRGTRELFIGLLPALTAGINELVKLGIKQARPTGSCLTSCGMPSSHSAVAVSLLLYLVLDAAYRIERVKLVIIGMTDVWATLKQASAKLAKGLFVLPAGPISPGEFAFFMACWCPLLLPVPLSRVLLNDHSPSQAMAGTFVGFLAVSIWFPLVLNIRWKLRNEVGTKFGYIFVHNYDIPDTWKEKSHDDATADPLVSDTEQENEASV
jgi:membrane-associated phospholipid phosphatase